MRRIERLKKLEQSNNFCLCGCGQKVINKFIRGHSTKPWRGKTYEEIFGNEKAYKIKMAIHQAKFVEKEPRFCLCGCGQKVINKFIRGHFNKLRIGKTNEEIYGKEKANNIKLIKSKPIQKRNVSKEQLEKERIYRNTEYNRNYRKAYQIKNREKKRIFCKQRRLENLNVRIVENLRTRINRAVIRKTKHTTELLGCTIEQLRFHLESKFKPGMSWDNYGVYGWHIDHVVPCIAFDLTDIEQEKRCFHYSNLQPLWAEENLSKHAKVL
jgi:hypothetical protein